MNNSWVEKRLVSSHLCLAGKAAKGQGGAETMEATTSFAAAARHFSFINCYCSLRPRLSNTSWLHCHSNRPLRVRKGLIFGISLPLASCTVQRLSGISSSVSELCDNGNSQRIREKDKGMPKIDKSGRFCSPRAARELALMIIYASCLEGSDPVRLFEKRLNARRESGYQFDKESLLDYDHMSFGGPPVTTESPEEANDLLSHNDKESAIEAEVLLAPPKLVYSKLLLRFARKLLVAVVEKWDSNVLVIENVVPLDWKNKPAGRILELCILHMALSEITVLGTRHQIVINEAIDLAKRFCDGAAPRIINGCLRSLTNNLSDTPATQTLRSKS